MKMNFNTPICASLNYSWKKLLEIIRLYFLILENYNFYHREESGI